MQTNEKYNVKTLNNIKIFNKHKSNAVGADASVHLEKNQNRNNIRTLDKHKSNVVGEASLGDPLIKQKHTNKSTSNTAITLIALIITIIVLLILAGVTLSMVMGESGIFGKANKAKEQTQISTAKEIIRMQVLENEAYKSTNDSKAKSDEELLQPIEDKLTEEGYKVEEGKTIDGKLATYNNPIIPAGFRAVDNSIDSTIDSNASWTTGEGYKYGLVIQDKEGNQFVWIAVDGTNVELDRYPFDENLNWNSESYTKYSETKDEAWAQKVSTYGGYYIGRYETKYENNKCVVKQ